MRVKARADYTRRANVCSPARRGSPLVRAGQGSTPSALSGLTDAPFTEANGSTAHSRPPYGSLAALQYPRLGADYSLDGASLAEASTLDSLDSASSMPTPRDSRRESKPKNFKRFWCWLKKKRSPKDLHPCGTLV